MEKCLADKQFLPISEINLVEPNKPQLATKIIIMLISALTASPPLFFCKLVEEEQKTQKSLCYS